MTKPKKRNKITQETLKEILNYDKNSGIFTWKICPTSNVEEGRVAGYKNHQGYIVISYKYTKWQAHRLAWLYEYGYLPEHQVDHINRNRSANNISNLREVTQECNLRNTGNPKDNSTGVKGVYFNNYAKNYQVNISVYGKRHYLGSHDTILEAACHRLAAEQSLGWAGCDSQSPAFKYVQGMLA